MVDLNPIDSIVNGISQQGLSEINSASFVPGSAAGRKAVEKEFTEIFYKELLRQAFKPPSIIQEDNPFPSPVNNELLVDQLARELLKDQELLDIR